MDLPSPDRPLTDAATAPTGDEDVYAVTNGGVDPLRVRTTYRDLPRPTTNAGMSLYVRAADGAISATAARGASMESPTGSRSASRRSTAVTCGR